jgi:ribosomal-protein-alanine N-acetyltransferase
MTIETDGTEFAVSSVSRFWLPKLVEIDATWNPSSWSERLFEGEFENQNAEILGLFAREELIGYLIAHIICDEAHIVSLGLHPSWTRRGGGRFLLQSFLSKCEIQGVKRITLEVRASNQPAQQLYLSLGFVVSGVRVRYYSSNQEDAVSMCWNSKIL